MANNKTRQGLDKPAGDTLKSIDDALDWLVQEAENQKLKPDEFTSEMAFQKLIDSGQSVTLASIRNKLERMAKSGELKSRKVLVNQRCTNAYQRV